MPGKVYGGGEIPSTISFFGGIKLKYRLYSNIELGILFLGYCVCIVGIIGYIGACILVSFFGGFTPWIVIGFTLFFPLFILITITYYKQRYYFFSIVSIDESGISLQNRSLTLFSARWEEIVNILVIVEVIKGSPAFTIGFSKDDLNPNTENLKYSKVRNQKLKKISTSSRFFSTRKEIENVDNVLKYCPKEKTTWIRDNYCPQEIFNKYRYRNYWNQDSI